MLIPLMVGPCPASSSAVSGSCKEPNCDVERRSVPPKSRLNDPSMFALRVAGEDWEISAEVKDDQVLMLTLFVLEISRFFGRKREFYFSARVSSMSSPQHFGLGASIAGLVFEDRG